MIALFMAKLSVLDLFLGYITDCSLPATTRAATVQVGARPGRVQSMRPVRNQSKKAALGPTPPSPACAYNGRLRGIDSRASPRRQWLLRSAWPAIGRLSDDREPRYLRRRG